MLLTIPDSSFMKTPQKREGRPLIRFGLTSLVIFLIILVTYQVLVVSFFRAETSPLEIEFSGEVFRNPYQTKDWKSGSEKIALHTHSDNIWYTPERHSQKDIEEIYKNNGYSLTVFTDYGKINKSESNSEILTGYEWGLNLRKRHALVIGSENTFSDIFPFYARRDNVSWTFQKIREQAGYIIIAHPKLNDSFTREDLVTINNYHAIEVYSPFGDDPKILDVLLSKGRNIHCMSSDDLHYFPESLIQKLNQPQWKNILQTLMLQRGREGESLKRYVVTANGEKTPSAVKTSLANGSFYCVKKHFREAEDPKLPNLKIDSSGLLTLDSSERYLEVRWIGKGGEMKKIDPDTSSSSYQFSDQDPYIRLEIVGLSGTILSNAIYRTKSAF